MRAAQLDLARQKETLEFIKSFIDFIAANGYNTLALYLEGKIRTATFPYPDPADSYTPAEMQEVVAYAAKKKIDVIPIVSNLGHTEQFLRYPQLAHLAELREGGPGRFSSALMQICPSLDATYDFFESYYSEIAAIFPSSYFHVGCDESWDTGFCSLCRPKVDKAGEHALFTGHLLRTHRFVTAKLKKQMIIWDDLFESYPESLPAIPRDIVMCTWLYDPVFDLPGSHFFNRKREDLFRHYDQLGFSYIIAPRERIVANVTSCTRYAAKHKPLGGLVTSWEGSTGFLYKNYPVFGFAGRLWSGAPPTDENALLKKTVRSVFSSGDPALLDAAGLYAQRRTWPYATRPEYFPAGSPSLIEQERRAETRLLAGVFGRAETASPNDLGRRVLADIRADLAQELVEHDLRAAVPALREAQVSGRTDKEPRAVIAASVKRLRALAKTRARHWKEWRTGIPHDQASGALNRRAEKFETLLKTVRPAGIVYLDLFLPDMYAAPITRISLWDAKKRAWKKIITGSLKPRFEEEACYRIAVPFPGGITPGKIRFEVWAYGGQGICFVEVLTRAGKFVPAAVERADGAVRDAKHLLFEDQRWAWLGETDVYGAFHHRKIATAVHSLTLTLRRA